MTTKTLSVPVVLVLSVLLAARSVPAAVPAQANPVCRACQANPAQAVRQVAKAAAQVVRVPLARAAQVSQTLRAVPAQALAASRVQAPACHRARQACQVNRVRQVVRASAPAAPVRLAKAACRAPAVRVKAVCQHRANRRAAAVR